MHVYTLWWYTKQSKTHPLWNAVIRSPLFLKEWLHNLSYQTGWYKLACFIYLLGCTSDLMWCSSLRAYHPQRASISHCKYSCLPPAVWISEEPSTIQYPEHKALCQTTLLLWRWCFRKIGSRKPSSACETSHHAAAQCWTKDGSRISGSLRPALSSCTGNHEWCSSLHCRQTVSTLRRLSFKLLDTSIN